MADNVSRSGHVSPHVVVLAASVGALLATGFLPWYDDNPRFFSNENVLNGFGEPLPFLLPVALVLGLVLVLDGLAVLSGRSLLTPLGVLDRSRVRSGIGLVVLALVGYKFLFRREDGDVGLFIGLGLAALIAYEAYAIGVLSDAAQGRDSAADVTGS